MIPGASRERGLAVNWETTKNAIMAYMQWHGYWTLFFAMAVEGTGLPIPMEFLFIPAAFAVSAGKLNLGTVIGVSTLGGVLGNLVGYFLGRYGGNAFIRRFGHCLRIGEQDLAGIRRWFIEHGGRTVLASRFVGFIRAPSILTAGLLRMHLPHYILFSAVGALLWNSFWAAAAWLLGAQLPAYIARAHHYLAWPLAVLLVAGGAWAVYQAPRWAKRWKDP